MDKVKLPGVNKQGREAFGTANRRRPVRVARVAGGCCSGGITPVAARTPDAYENTERNTERPNQAQASSGCRVQGTAQTNQTCIHENTAAYPVPSRDLILHRTRPPCVSSRRTLLSRPDPPSILAPKNKHRRTAACLARHARFRTDHRPVARVSAQICCRIWQPAPISAALAHFGPQ